MSESLTRRTERLPSAAVRGAFARLQQGLRATPGWVVSASIGLLLPMMAFVLQPFIEMNGQVLTWFLFFPAVFFSGWAGGLVGGAVATLASVVLVHGFILPPSRHASFGFDAEFAQLLVFIAVGFLVSLLHGQLRRAVRRIDAARLEAQSKSERLAQLSGQLEQARSRLQLAVDSAHIGVWSWDFRTDQVEWDERTCAMLEATPEIVAQGLHKEHWRSRVRAEDVELVGELRASARELTYPTRSIVRFRRADGGIRHLQTTSIVLREEGREIGMIGTNLDVSSEVDAIEALSTREREIETLNRQLEDRVFERTSALVEALQRADAAAQARTAFLENVSHELRTPLNPIIGFSSVLSGLVDDPDQRTQLRYISAGGRRLLSLVTDLLELTRKSSEGVDIAPVDVPAVLESAALAFETRVAEKGLRVVVEPGPSLPPDLHGDSVRLTQVLMQLLSNAVRFSERGTIRLRALPIEQSTALATVKFEVQDEGIGIPTDLQPQIFEAFAQAERGMQRRHGGLGIGLAVARKAIERLGGQIGVRSEPGKGSTFWFTVPFLVVDAAQTARKAGRAR